MVNPITTQTVPKFKTIFEQILKLLHSSNLTLMAPFTTSFAASQKSEFNGDQLCITQFVARLSGFEATSNDINIQCGYEEVGNTRTMHLVHFDPVQSLLHRTPIFTLLNLPDQQHRQQQQHQLFEHYKQIVQSSDDGDEYFKNQCVESESDMAVSLLLNMCIPPQLSHLFQTTYFCRAATLKSNFLFQTDDHQHQQQSNSIRHLAFKSELARNGSAACLFANRNFVDFQLGTIVGSLCALFDELLLHAHVQQLLEPLSFDDLVCGDCDFFIANANKFFFSTKTESILCKRTPPLSSKKTYALFLADNLFELIGIIIDSAFDVSRCLVIRQRFAQVRLSIAMAPALDCEDTFTVGLFIQCFPRDAHNDIVFNSLATDTIQRKFIDFFCFENEHTTGVVSALSIRRDPDCVLFSLELRSTDTDFIQTHKLNPFVKLGQQTCSMNVFETLVYIHGTDRPDTASELLEEMLLYAKEEFTMRRQEFMSQLQACITFAQFDLNALHFYNSGPDSMVLDIYSTCRMRELLPLPRNCHTHKHQQALLHLATIVDKYCLFFNENILPFILTL